MDHISQAGWAVILYVVTCAIGTMPPKGTKWDAGVWYEWFYDFCHVAINNIGSRVPRSSQSIKEQKNVPLE